MNGKEDLIEDIGESFGYVNLMIDKRIEQAKLTIAERSATTVSALITNIALGVIGGTSLLFLLIGLAFWIADDTFHSVARGFAIVAGILLLILLIIYLIRKQLIVNPTVRKVIGIFFPKTEK